MILDTITLHNFMSYSDIKLDLASVNIACLVGPNGAGKSALLDAITWAFWESARSSSDELIRLGQNEMWVDITFTHNNQHYRIRRSRVKSSPRQGSKIISKGTLDFQVLNNGNSHVHDEASGNGSNGNGDGKWLALSAASMRDTQSRIINVLAMDADTFLNSVYLKQGRSDEFTKRAPGERKQVLAEILGLNYFDQIQELAKDEAKRIKLEIEYLNSSLEQQKGCEIALAEAEFMLANNQQEFDLVTNKVKDYEKEIESNKSKISDLKVQASQANAIEKRLNEIDSDIKVLQNQKEEQLNKSNKLKVILENKEEIESQGLRFAELKQIVEKSDETALAIHDLETKQHSLKSQIANRQSRLELEIDSHRQQLSQLKADQSKLEKETSNINKLEKEFEEFKQLLGKEAQLSKSQEMHVQLTERAQKLQADIDEARVRVEVELAQKQTRLKELEELLVSKSLLEQEKGNLTEQAEVLDKLEVEFELVEEKGLALKSELDKAALEVQELKRRKQANIEKVQELTQVSELSVCPLCAAPIVDRKAVIDDYHKHNSDIDSEIFECEQKITQLSSKRDQLRKEYAELREKLEARSVLDVNIGKFNEKLEAIRLAEESIAQIREQIESLKKNISVYNYAQVERESLIGVKAEVHKLDFDPIIFASLQSQIRSKRHVEARFHQMKRDLNELEQIGQRIPELQNKIREISKQLEEGLFASEMQDELKEIEKNIAQYQYDRHKHHKLRQELARLISITEEVHDLHKAEQELPEILDEISQLEVKIAQKTKEYNDEKEKQEEIKTLAEQLPELESSLANMQDNLIKVSMQKDELLEKVAITKSQSTQLKEEKEALDAKKEKLILLQMECDDFNDLVVAFGKKGIQAIIIENTLPEIENEANYILGKLSENQMHLGLISQQTNRSGNSVETLDILIADNLGTRNYELYSGGEAFKINFALRVALSSLLARRSGASLETLIIDEGFGSQDESSRLRLIQAINAIAHDFARILVVTHISEIKEMFPVQISVNKEDGISEVQIQGV